MPARVREDQKLSEAEREPAVKLYGTIALSVLRRAVAGGYKDVAALQAMPELAAPARCARIQRRVCEVHRRDGELIYFAEIVCASGRTMFGTTWLSTSSWQMRRWFSYDSASVLYG